MEGVDTVLGSFECAVLSPLVVLYMSSQTIDVRAGTLKILLHVLEVFIFKSNCWLFDLLLLTHLANSYRLSLCKPLLSEAWRKTLL